LIRVGMSSKQAYQLSCDPILWQELYNKRFDTSIKYSQIPLSHLMMSMRVNNSKDKNWKEEYKEQVLAQKAMKLNTVQICGRCGKYYSEGRNTPLSCKAHPGTFKSNAFGQYLWSCCKNDFRHSKGCVSYKHINSSSFTGN